MDPMNSIDHIIRIIAESREQLAGNPAGGPLCLTSGPSLIILKTFQTPSWIFAHSGKTVFFSCGEMIMKAESHVVWSTRKEIDLGDPSQKKSYIQDVLTNGLALDVSKLDWKEIERILPYLKLPERVFRLWRSYFEHAKR
jgi:hypothetical protein